ncbi:hypothetical protein NDU88_004583 [Pleurodeles waltl]|uniref:Helix-turn-helix domain-containing protein n=1 Tax=Pleurodeles waltl TaxID=8319 RepID=A0AAV7WW37_PLEWA|nr:hypothetical protein NDU88_004583 [Pleurodeles waltl]
MGESITPPEFILDLAHLALTRNYFKFDESFFLQTQGTSMGSTFAPSLACLYVDNFKRLVVLHDDNPYRDQIKLWKRYIDDVLLVWTGNKEEALAFAVWLNGANPFLTFTMTIGDNKLPFLDLLIYEHDGGLATEVHYKPTDSNNLLQYQSFHPRALKNYLPVGQFPRLRRNCSSVADYRKHADKLATKLQTKDYPTHLVNRVRRGLPGRPVPRGRRGTTFPGCPAGIASLPDAQTRSRAMTTNWPTTMEAPLPSPTSYYRPDHGQRR